ncbi:Chemotaxis protein CheW [Burkholderiales bacterium]|nr:Chemotaxis protein CheW [Burkholderiales bacterium]
MGALVKAECRAIETAKIPETQQYLTFSLGGEMFAIGILRVKEIIEYSGVTAVPLMPECVRGVINLRGAVVPVIDLGCRFGHGSAAISRRTCIVIVEVELDAEDERHDVGVIVDAVSAVIEIPAAEIEPAPAFGARLRTDFIQGMARGGSGFVILLQVDRVLSIDDLAVLAELSSRVPERLNA